MLGVPVLTRLYFANYDAGFPVVHNLPGLIINGSTGSGRCTDSPE